MSDPELNILLLTDTVVVLDKPAGIAVIPGRGEGADGCLRAMMEQRLGARLWVVHRLDRDVSGVLVFARTAAEHRRLSIAFEQHRVEKSYWALVEERVRDERRTIELPIRSGLHGGKSIVDLKRGKPARTSFSRVEAFERWSVLHVVPHSGRTHQIRVHLKAIGHPLAVDRRYGRRADLRASDLAGRARAAGEESIVTQATLHARELLLPAADGGEALRIEAPLPPALARALLILRGGRGQF